MADENINTEMNQSQENNQNIETNQSQEDFGKFKNADEYYRSKYNPDSLLSDEEIKEKYKNQEKKDDSNQNQEEKKKFGIIGYEKEEQEKQIDSNQNQITEPTQKRKVKFLGEDVEIDPSEENDLIQMGLNYKRKQKELEEKENAYNQYTEKEKKILEFTGAKDFNELESIIEQNRIQEEAQRILDANPGITEEYARRLAENESKTRIQEQKLKEFEQSQKIFEIQQQNNTIRQNFVNDKYYKDVSPIAEQMIQKSPMLRYDNAYTLAKGVLFDRLMEQNNSNNTASTIANMKSRDTYKNDSSESKNSGSNVVNNSVIDEVTKAFKGNYNKIRDYVNKQIKK